MWISIGNLYCHLERASDGERYWLNDYLAFRDAKAHFKRGRAKDQRIRLFSYRHKTFPTGLLPAVIRGARRDGLKVEIADQRVIPVTRDTGADLSWLHTHQHRVVGTLVRKGRGLAKSPTGSGKCLAPDVPILRYDGSVVTAKEVRVGDMLMGPDSEPRTVLSTTSGHGPRYKINPNKGDPWECNDVHVLTLVHTQSGRVLDIPLDEYLTKSKTFKHEHKLFCTGVDFPEQPRMPVDPYFVGLWIGDGRKSLQTVEVTKEDPEVLSALRATASDWGCEVTHTSVENRCTSWRLVTPLGQTNALLSTMRELFPLRACGTRVPAPGVFTGSYEERLALLAGICDTDGHLAGGYFEVSQRTGPISDGIAFLARSLGFRVTHSHKAVNGTLYDRWSILGDVERIPTRIPRKQATPRKMNKDATRTGFSVEFVSNNAPYSGFTLDGDGRFLLGDFTVTHNTEMMIAILRALPCKWGLFVHSKDLMHQAADRYELRERERYEAEMRIYEALPGGPQGEPEPEPPDLAGRIGDGRWSEGDRLTCATFQTLYRARKNVESRLFLESLDGLLVDEVHMLPADSFYSVAMSTPNAYYRMGFSGTPLSRGDRKSLLAIAALGPLQCEIDATSLVDKGILAKPRIRMLTCVQPEAGLTQATWQGVYGAGVVRSTERNKLLVRAAQRATKPCLLFVKEIKHGKEMVKRLKSVGLRSHFVYGNNETAVRNELIRMLEMGEVDVLVCSVIFQEGVDIPDLRSVVIGSGGKSTIAALQRIGRGMRIADGKDEFEVYDIYDVGHRWMERHSKQRMGAYQKEGFEVVVEQASIPARSAI